MGRTIAFRQIFASQLMPDATKEQLDWFNEMQRRTASPECAARYFTTVAGFDVTALLPKVTVPTLVMHAREEVAQPVELGRELAAGIPGAKFVAFPGRNHLPLEQDATMPRVIEEIDLFPENNAWQRCVSRTRKLSDAAVMPSSCRPARHREKMSRGDEDVDHFGVLGKNASCSTAGITTSPGPQLRLVASRNSILPFDIRRSARCRACGRRRAPASSATTIMPVRGRRR
jgi:hypothetical protein